VVASLKGLRLCSMWPSISALPPARRGSTCTKQQQQQQQQQQTTTHESRNTSWDALDRGSGAEQTHLLSWLLQHVLLNLTSWRCLKYAVPSWCHAYNKCYTLWCCLTMCFDAIKEQLTSIWHSNKLRSMVQFLTYQLTMWM
jgi:hypothetical protein